MVFMRTVLIIAGREILRLRARFNTKMLAAVIILLVMVAVISFFILRQGAVMVKDLYIIGVSPSAPRLDDPRFNIIRADPREGIRLLNDGQLDVYLTGTALFSRQDDRSQYAVGAVKSHLLKSELERIGIEYPLNRAFPLRVELNYLKTSAAAGNRSASLTLADILESSSRVREQNGLPGASAVQPLNPAEHERENSITQAVRPSPTDEQISRQLADLQSGNILPQFKAQFAGDKQVVIPSLMNPPIPLAQVLLAFAYILPIFFISIFFTGSFIEEKMARKINVLLSAPVTPFQVIIGKMLPYIGYSLLIVIFITLILKGNLLLSLAIFLPVILFIFSIYLGVALQYRSYRDQTFFSLVAVTGITAYLVFPAMFVGISDLSYISPLTLAVQMYRGIPITVYQYLLSAVPMTLIFVLAITLGTRVFNEEYLLSFRPLYIKIREAVFLAMDKRRIAASVAVFSLLLIPVVFILELATITVCINLPRPLALGLCIFICVLIEEIAKSLTVVVSIERGLVRKWTAVIWLAVVSAFSFFAGEKLLLFMSLKVISESVFTTAIFAGNLLWLPLIAHAVCTLTVCLVTYRTGIRGYPLALLAGSLIHGAYNLSLLGVLR